MLFEVFLTFLDCFEAFFYEILRRNLYSFFGNMGEFFGVLNDVLQKNFIGCCDIFFNESSRRKGHFVER